VTVCSSTGFLLPGLSAYLVEDLRLPRSTGRLDIVGMGCHAGLNSLQAAANWAAAHRGKLAIACGVEVCSALYLWPDDDAATESPPASATKARERRQRRINHAVVNSLFSDGCFALALFSPAHPTKDAPQAAACSAATPHPPSEGHAMNEGAVDKDAVGGVGANGSVHSEGLAGGQAAACPGTTTPEYYLALHAFESLTAPATLELMRYQWDEESDQLFFHLSEMSPYAVGSGLLNLLHDATDAGYQLEQVRHWVVHTGGQTVIDAAAAALGLDLPELETSVRALKKYGNNSSTSFMFVFSEFLDSPPSPVHLHDRGLFITMGPGAGLELCLWTVGPRSTSPPQAWLPLSRWSPASLLLPSRTSLVRHVASAGPVDG